MNDISKQQIHNTMCQYMYVANSTMSNFLSVSGLEGEPTTVRYYYVEGDYPLILKEVTYKYPSKEGSYYMTSLVSINHQDTQGDVLKVSDKFLLTRCYVVATDNAANFWVYLNKLRS